MEDRVTLLTEFSKTNPRELYKNREQEGENKTQRERILEELQEGVGVSCKVFLRMGIAQYNARIYELRRLGYNITSYNENGMTFFELEK